MKFKMEDEEDLEDRRPLIVSGSETKISFRRHNYDIRLCDSTSSETEDSTKASSSLS